MIRFVSAFLFFAAFATVSATPADASNCHVQQVVLQRHYVAPYVAPVYYPYAIGYNPANEQLEAFKFLFEKYDQRTNELIQAIKANPGGGPLLPLKAAHPGDLVMANRCATCHDETTAKAKGNGKVFFRGGAFLDNPDNVSAVIGAAIEEGSMPKGGKLTDTEKLDLMRRLVIQTGGAK